MSKVSMRLKLDDPTLFSKAIDLISDLVLESKIKINEFGLSIVAIDPANVSMISLKIPKSSFSEFEHEDDSLGINMDSLKKTLKRCKPTSSLILEKNENKLELKIEDKTKKNFSLNLIEIEGEDKEFPAHLEFTTTVITSGNELIESIEDAAVVADSCLFISAEGKFIVEAKDLNSVKTEFSSDAAKVEGADAKSRYGIDYLTKFLKASRYFDTTTLNFSTDHPLRVDFTSSLMTLSFLLAPRIETDE